jgi:glycine/sarcosine N-methyltransferase
MIVDPIQFYDSLASEYDEMTGFSGRFAKEGPIFKKLVDRYELKTALDIGCGTGFHSIMLAQLGLRVTATDISEKMLQQTQKNADHADVRVNTIQTSFQDLNKSVKEKFDTVFCLGNTLPHILTARELLSLFRNLTKLLNPGGFIFLQLLNYDRILINRERIQSIKEVNGKTTIRFYDYEKKTIIFNILTLQKYDGAIKHALASVRLYPWCSSDIVRNLYNSGYKDVHLFGSIAQNAFNQDSSKDLIVFAS